MIILLHVREVRDFYDNSVLRQRGISVEQIMLSDLIAFYDNTNAYIMKSRHGSVGLTALSDLLTQQWNAMQFRTSV